MENKLLTDEEIQKIQHKYPCLDLSMIDDYRSEVETLLEAQLSKDQKHEDERVERIKGNLYKLVDEHKHTAHSGRWYDISQIDLEEFWKKELRK